jgi:GT2 family glycosyltransferase
VTPSLDIVIVNWNAGPQLAACLASIEATSRQALTLASVVVVDNASSDGSATGLGLRTANLAVVVNKQNAGFGVACNQGAAACSADFILFLNPDTVLGKQSLDDAVRFMADPAHANIGVCGVQLVDAKGRIARSCARFPTFGSMLTYSLGLDRISPRLFPTFFMREWPHDSDRVVDHVIGAFYLVRRSVFQSVGGFDPRFFVYMEDLDLSKRVFDAGFLVHYLASARVFHEGGGTSSQVKAERLVYSLRSRLQYAFKHLGRFSGFLLLACALCVEPFVRLAGAAVAGSPGQVRDTLRAYVQLWGQLPALTRTLAMGNPAGERRTP